MIIFKASGRLGNQIFQYAALKTILEDREGLVLFGFEELQGAFEGIDATIINGRSSVLEKVLYRGLFHCLSTSRLCTHIKESGISNVPKIDYSPGLLRTVKVVEESYFQSEDFFHPRVLSSVSISQKLKRHAEKFIAKVSSEHTLVFVHIRRGDYITWPSKEAPATLPDSYYIKCMGIIRSRYKNPFFIFMSDDSSYVRDRFGTVENSYISQEGSLEDFALMTYCHSGILSASSFSWWAAYLSFEKDKKSSFLAPKYWVGHRNRKWYPKFINSRSLEFINV